MSHLLHPGTATVVTLPSCPPGQPSGVTLVTAPSMVTPLLTFRLLPPSPTTQFSFCEEFYYFSLPEAGGRI